MHALGAFGGRDCWWGKRKIENEGKFTDLSFGVVTATYFKYEAEVIFKTQPFSVPVCVTKCVCMCQKI